MGFFLIILFGCGYGDLKRMDFWDWLFGRGFDVEFRACFEKGQMYMCERMGERWG